jgi:hypothetical protein
MIYGAIYRTAIKCIRFNELRCMKNVTKKPKQININENNSNQIQKHELKSIIERKINKVYDNITIGYNTNHQLQVSL